MKLLRHILRKDIRHFYPEILLHLALLLTFAFETSYGPSHIDDVASSMSRVVLRFLIPVVWLIMISRLLHDETLVGDRQFWITRPYPWTTLLLEKAVFLIAFLHLPLLLLQMYLLHRAGFPIAPSIAHLFAFQLWVAAFFDLPFVAIGVLTPTLTAHMLSVLGGLVYLIALLAVGNQVLGQRMSPPLLDWITVAIALLSPLLVILLMYARRRAGLRWLLIGLPPALLLLWLCAPAALIIHHAYAATPAEDQLTFVSDAKEQQGAEGTPTVTEDKDVLVDLPLRFQAARGGELALRQGTQITLRSADGYRWSSEFENASNWSRSGETSRIGLRVPLSVYARLADGPVRLDLHIVGQTFLEGPEQTVVMPASGPFTVPFAGLCNTNWSRDALRCESPLWVPAAADTTFEVQNAPCGTPGVTSVEPRPLSGGTGSLHVDLDPVYTQDIGMWQDHDDPGARHDRFLCPGAGIRIAPLTPGRREEWTVSQPNVRLSLYVLKTTTAHGVHGTAGPIVGITRP